MSIPAIHILNEGSYSPDDLTIPRPVNYVSSPGVREEKSPVDHVHPIFVEGWHYAEPTDLLNGWNNAEGTVSLFRFLRDPMGFVHISGKLDAGTVATGTDIYVLPVGYRPEMDHRFPVVTSSGAAMATILLRSQGIIEVGPMVVNTNLYFSGITFEADRNTFDSFTV